MTAPRQRREIRRKAARGAEFDSKRLEDILATAEGVLGTLLNDIDLQEVRIRSANDAYKILNAATGLIRAKVELSKWDAERTALLEIAKEEFYLACQEEFAARPELLSQVYEVIDAAAAPK